MCHIFLIQFILLQIELEVHCLEKGSDEGPDEGQDGGPNEGLDGGLDHHFWPVASKQEMLRNHNHSIEDKLA
jgi:hypothetical protein